jgi:purine-nucleoside phosphorylase
MNHPPVPWGSPDTDPFEVAAAAAKRLAEITGADRHDIAVVLGSGWAPTANLLGEELARVDAADLPGFRPPAVAGHTGTIRSVRVDGSDRRALILNARTHLYEGLGAHAVAHGARTAAATGCRVLVLTNGCGSLVPAWGPGTPVLIRDHLNLTGTSPLEGARFVDMTDLYSTRLREICRAEAGDLPEGVYVQFRGPQYETPAEVAMARIMGGHLVGMSTALEAIAARASGLEVLGLSLVTNPAAGTGTGPLSHDEVVAAGDAAAHRVGAMLARVLPRL